MKSASLSATFILLAAVCLRVHAQAINLGAAGPQNWAVLEINEPPGDNGNINIANASSAGVITGNVGIASSGGNISDSGTPISGGAYLSPTSGNGGITPTPGSGTTTYTAGNYSSSILSASSSAAINAGSTYGALGDTGGGVGVTSITSGGSLAPGVYNLTEMELNAATVQLQPGAQYVFNISGTLKLQGQSSILDSTPGDVLFNITGTQGVQINGGLSQESVLDGIILAPEAQVALSPGIVNGEIVSGENLQIVSGASVIGNGTTCVPDAGSSLLLLSIALGLLVVTERATQPAAKMTSRL